MIMASLHFVIKSKCKFIAHQHTIKKTRTEKRSLNESKYKKWGKQQPTENPGAHTKGNGTAYVFHGANGKSHTLCRRYFRSRSSIDNNDNDTEYSVSIDDNADDVPFIPLIFVNNRKNGNYFL